MKVLNGRALQVGSRFKKYRTALVMILVCVVLGWGCIALGYMWHARQARQDLSFWKQAAAAPEPEHCVLCEYKEKGKRCAPVLIDLSTGAIDEMQVDETRENGGELSANEQSGSFSFISCAGLTGWRDTATHTLHLTLPEEENLMDVSLFCHRCRAILANTSSTGFIVLDLFDVDAIKIYKIETGNFAIRNYEMSVLQGEKSSEITICERK